VAAVVDCDEVRLAESVWVKSEPIFEGACSPDSETGFIDEFNRFDFRDGDAFTGTDGEEVAFDGESALSNLDIFVIVENRGTEVHFISQTTIYIIH